MGRAHGAFRGLICDTTHGEGRGPFGPRPSPCVIVRSVYLSQEPLPDVPDIMRRVVEPVFA
jgi:hypothetical protein